jgi:hypothetical protein
MTPEHKEFIELVRLAITEKPEEFYGHDGLASRVRRQVVLGLLAIIETEEAAKASKGKRQRELRLDRGKPTREKLL